MDGQGTEDHVKALRREWGLRHIPPDIGHLRSRGLFPGHGQHFLRQVHAGDSRRAVFRRIDAVPAVAAAQIQHPLPGEVRQQGLQGLPLPGARQSQAGAVHLAVFFKKPLSVVRTLLHPAHSCEGDMVQHSTVREKRESPLRL